MRYRTPAALEMAVKAAAKACEIDSTILVERVAKEAAARKVKLPKVRQRSMHPAHMSRLAASPLADIAKPPDRKRLRQASDNGSNMLRHAIFYAHVMPELEGTRSCLDLN